MYHSVTMGSKSHAVIPVVLATGLLALATTCMFVYRANEGRRFLGDLTMGHEFLTGSTVLMTKNWYREGAWQLRFLQLWNPASLEFPTLFDRQPYYSAPPGTLIPVYLLCRVLNREPTPELVMQYNVATHGLAAFTIAILVFIFLLTHGMDVLPALLWSLVPPFIQLLLPATMFWRQNIYYSDQAVVLPYVLFALCEMIYDLSYKAPGRRALTCVQAFLLWYGVLTDWFMLLTAMVVYAKRIVRGQIASRPRAFLQQSLFFWLPAGIALGLFVAQLLYTGTLRALLMRALLYTGTGHLVKVTWNYFYATFWAYYVRTFYGAAGEYLLWATLGMFVLILLYVAFQRARGWAVPRTMADALSLAAIFILPPFIYLHGLRTYAVAHSFAADKMTMVLAVATFVAVPYLIAYIICSFRWRTLSVLRSSLLRWLRYVVVLAGVLSVAAAALWYMAGPLQRRWWGGPDPAIKLRGEFLGRHTGYRDLVFSPNFSIPFRVPQLTCYSMKLVYKTPTLFDIVSRVHAWAREEDCVVNLLFIQPITNIDMHIVALTGLACQVHCSNDMSLYKLTKAAFLNYAAQHEATNIAHIRWLESVFSDTPDARRVYLADLPTLQGSNLVPGRFSLFGRGADNNGNLLTVWGRRWRKGIHLIQMSQAGGIITCPLNGKYRRFRSLVTIADVDGKAVFRVLLDGRQIFTSGTRHARDVPLLVDVDVRGGQTLTLSAQCSHCISVVWCDPYLLPD